VRGRSSRRDAGAVAVEFALLLPLLMLFLFGIIQYGYGLFQLQTFNATLNEAASQAATGIADCALFSGEMKTMARGDGLDPQALTNVRIEWINEDGSHQPERLGYARVTAEYKPFKIGLPFIPFPDTFTGTRTVLVQNITDPACP
jgi:hypothetical protein